MRAVAFSLYLILFRAAFDIVNNEGLEDDLEADIIGLLKVVSQNEDERLKRLTLSHQYEAGEEELYLNISELINKNKFSVEEHYVTTNDGYELTLVRIPSNGISILLMHGLFLSADEFVTPGSESGLAYLLASEGYDVWMGNVRGNKYSRKHKHLSPDTDKDFWNFSWHEIGYYDLPATIDYILTLRNTSQLIYIGHSQGTTAFYVMCSERAEYNNKIALMISMASAAWMSYLKSPIVKAMARFDADKIFLTERFGYWEILPDNIFMKLKKNHLCGHEVQALLICTTITFSLFGFDYEQVNIPKLPVILTHMTSGSSSKQIKHYLQGINSNKFRQYDYGRLRNLEVYGTESPPDYNVGRVTCPVAVLYSTNDWLSSFTDVENLIKKLPNVVEIYKVPFPKFNHIDYLWAKDIKILVYNKLSQLIYKYKTLS